MRRCSHLRFVGTEPRVRPVDGAAEVTVALAGPLAAAARRCIRQGSTSNPEATAIATAEGTGARIQASSGLWQSQGGEELIPSFAVHDPPAELPTFGAGFAAGAVHTASRSALQIGSWCPRPSSAGGSACRGGPDATRGRELRRTSIHASPLRSRTRSSRGSPFGDCTIGGLSGLHQEHGAADWSSSFDIPRTSFAAIAWSNGSSSLSAPEKLGEEHAIRTLREPCLHRPRFYSPQYAARAIGDWIAFHHRRPIPTLDIKPRRGMAARRPDLCKSARSIRIASCAASS